jgi:hypothetical protein
MQFDNLTENYRKNSGNFIEINYRDDNIPPQSSQNSHHRYVSNYKWVYFMETMVNNKKLKLLVLFAIVLILSIIIVLILVLLPIILNLFNYISQNGVQGIVDYCTVLLDKILKGSAK